MESEIDPRMSGDLFSEQPNNSNFSRIIDRLQDKQRMENADVKTVIKELF